jgi:hypothetical protein
MTIGDPSYQKRNHRTLFMHQNAVYSKLAAALAEAEARIMARLDAIEAKIGPAAPESSPEDATPNPRKATK